MMGISPMFRDIFAGVTFVAVIFALAWALPKFALQYAGGKTKPRSLNISDKPSRLLHDNVLWEDTGTNYFYGITVDGPLCPKDFAVLGMERRDKVENIRHDELVSDSGYHAQLVCPECNSKYTLGDKPKTIRESENEVRHRFEGKRRREQET